VTRRLFWYSGGLAELTGDEPEPRIMRWADVQTATTVFYESDETAARLTGCILSGSDGTEPVGLRGPAKISGYRGPGPPRPDGGSRPHPGAPLGPAADRGL